VIIGRCEGDKARAPEMTAVPEIAVEITLIAVAAAQSMIRKSGNRFSEKIMLHQKR
jgi:hypothetical protein